jgi:cytochrome d ubiquinol oxidase subunit II
MTMTLNEIWFVLFTLIIAGYLILDGFDMGVGILHLPLARGDLERRTFLNSIGPVWDGNEVWLVLGGGVLFAVFPLVYASVFSGFYLAFMLVLLVMILRTVAIEFRSKERSPRWRSAWDTVFWAASVGLAFLLGVAFGDVLSGVPIDADGNMRVTLIDLLQPFALLVGATTVAMFAMHGAIYLTMKTDGELQARIERALPRLIVAFFILNTLVVIAMVLFRQDITDRYTTDIWPVIFPAAALLALVAVWLFLRRGEPFRAFIASSATIGLLLVSGAIGLFPNLLISTTDPAYNLTITNAASADNTLVVCLIVAVIGIPFVLLYTTGVYYIFRGKATIGPDSY